MAAQIRMQNNVDSKTTLICRENQTVPVKRFHWRERLNLIWMFVVGNKKRITVRLF